MFSFQILLENVRINLMEDRPPVNITSPGPIPINLKIGKMRIVRDETGLFQIQPLIEVSSSETDGQMHTSCDNLNAAYQRKDRGRELLALQLVMQQLKLDNDVLRKQLTSTEKSSEVSK